MTVSSIMSYNFNNNNHRGGGGGGGGEFISLNSNSSSSSTWKDAGGRHITNADLLYGILSSADKQDLRLMSTTDTSKNTPSTSIVSEY